jgi:hypothetical protein
VLEETGVAQAAPHDWLKWEGVPVLIPVRPAPRGRVEQASPRKPATETETKLFFVMKEGVVYRNDRGPASSVVAR